MPTTKDLIDAYSAAKLTDDNTALALARATQDKEHSATDVTAAASALSADLQANGPAAVLTTEPVSITVYQYSPDAPGFTSGPVRVA